MKNRSPIFLSVVAVFLLTSPAWAQSSSASQTRPRTVTQVAQQKPQPQPSAAPDNSTTTTPAEAASNEPVGTEPTINEVSNRSVTMLTPPIIKSRITEAHRLLKSRPLATALTTPSIDFVTVAALERESGRTHLVTLSKEIFLKRGSEVALTTSQGTPINLRILRANGVNTALTIFTTDGKELVPLTVEYPIERNRVFREMAYYTSAHPALLSKELVHSGQAYVRDMIDLAARRLKDKGIQISPEIVNVAERLCIVEHIDHERFRAENRLALYDEIYSLYALNELNTYRYSVSVAGAGGMIQMIPWAYNLERARHPVVGLIPDFVTAMRNHGNALQAMLLYMQDTWNELYANDDVKYALNAKIATESEILAAGYNSNAAKLPGYIRRGNSNWKTLIPRETQMYLQIYKSFEALFPLKERTASPVTAAALEK